MNYKEFELDSVDSSGLFFQVGINKGQILGLTAPHILSKYMKLVPCYTNSRSCPSHLLDGKERKFGFVYSNTDVFDLANSYELGIGRTKTGTLNQHVDHVIFLNHLGGNRFSATTIDIATVARIAVNKKVNIGSYRKTTG
jgi:hypothetical protein